MLRVGKKNVSCSVGPTSLAMFCFRANRGLVGLAVLVVDLLHSCVCLFVCLFVFLFVCFLASGVVVVVVFFWGLCLGMLTLRGLTEKQSLFALLKFKVT